MHQEQDISIGPELLDAESDSIARSKRLPGSGLMSTTPPSKEKRMSTPTATAGRELAENNIGFSSNASRDVCFLDECIFTLDSRGWVGGIWTN